MAKRWYSVSVLSNFEKKIAEQIKQSVADAGLEDQIDEVLVPTEEVIEIRRGKKVTSERRFMPGYVLVHMEMSDRTYHLVNSINRVTGFLGAQGKPMPMRDDEVNAILHRSGEGGAEVAPAECEALSRACIIFDGGDAGATARARDQWRVLTGAGVAAEYWSEESGRWERKR